MLRLIKILPFLTLTWIPPNIKQVAKAGAPLAKDTPKAVDVQLENFQPVAPKDREQVEQWLLELDLVPLVAEAGKRNPRSIVRLLNRIIVTSRIGEEEGKDYNPLALLLHEAMDETRYEALCRALDITVIFEEDKGKRVIGEFLANQLKN